MKKIENNDAMLDRITLIATLYYKDKLSQQEIAKKLNISRPWVSKLLTRAEELGIVKIEIESPILGNTQLEQRLCDKYQLEYACVIDNSDTSRDYLSIAAVNYFISQIKPNDIIGVAWGNAISRFIRHIHPYGEFQSSTTLSENLKRYMKYAGMTVKKRKAAHSLRHTLASSLLYDGTPFMTISNILGHNRPKTTSVYTKVDLPALRKCALSYGERRELI